MSMMFETAEGPLEISDACVAAVISRADYVATLTGEFLTALGLIPNKAKTADGVWGLPAGFLLELGAMLQLAVWELAGIRTHLNAGLPSAHEAAADLTRRASENPSSFNDNQSAILLRRLFPLWVERLAWNGQTQFGTEVQIDTVGEDELVDRLAEFLWQHRGSLPSALELGEPRHETD
jgi:hypothetical protein